MLSPFHPIHTRTLKKRKQLYAFTPAPLGPTGPIAPRGPALPQKMITNQKNVLQINSIIVNTCQQTIIGFIKFSYSSLTLTPAIPTRPSGPSYPTSPCMHTKTQTKYLIINFYTLLHIVHLPQDLMGLQVLVDQVAQVDPFKEKCLY